MRGPERCSPALTQLECLGTFVGTRELAIFHSPGASISFEQHPDGRPT
jgi:hypothetical protein